MRKHPFEPWQLTRYHAGKCVERGCANARRASRTRCSSCASRRYRAANPLKATFNTLRFNARRRGKPFTLSFMEFLFFVNQTEYLRLKGRSALSLSIDRSDNDRGYTFDNIRAITVSENASKSDRQYYALVHKGIIPA